MTECEKRDDQFLKIEDAIVSLIADSIVSYLKGGRYGCSKEELEKGNRK